MTDKKEQLANFLAKLSLKGMGCQPRKGEFTPESAPRALCRLFGTVSDHEVISTTIGDSTRFKGDVEGINLATGEVYKSFKMFLPNIISEVMENALDKREDPEQHLEFGFEIGAQYSEKGRTGYAYTVKPFVKTDTRDALAHLREKAVADLPQLAAPVAAAEKAAPAAKAKK